MQASKDLALNGYLDNVVGVNVNCNFILKQVDD